LQFLSTNGQYHVDVMILKQKINFRPLKFLSSQGASLEDVDKEGTTPLMIAW
jgi:hypothetical protein